MIVADHWVNPLEFWDVTLDPNRGLNGSVLTPFSLSVSRLGSGEDILELFFWGGEFGSVSIALKAQDP